MRLLQELCFLDTFDESVAYEWLWNGWEYIRSPVFWRDAKSITVVFCWH
jgi:hypothetical protein